MKTMKENGSRATSLILGAVSLIAQEDWTTTIKDVKVGRLLVFSD